MKTIAWIHSHLSVVPLAMTAVAMLLSTAEHGAKAQETEGDSSEIIIVNNDDPGEGLNDPTPADPVAGNPGLTLGEQRLAVFEAAAEVWEGILVSDVPIEVQAQFDELACTSNAGTLAQAGPTLFFADFPGAVVPGTIYASAQANQQAGVDLAPDDSDLLATFNSRIGAPDCLAGSSFFLGIDDTPAPDGTIGLFDTILHEMAHGLGFLSVVNIETGAKLVGLDDIFSNNLEDQTLGPWPGLTDEERAASAISEGDLQWTGANVRACAAQVLQEGGATDGDVLMFAPNPLRPGSSVSHFDTSLSPDELMEPFATETSILDLTTTAFADMGWPISEAAAEQICGAPAQMADSLQ
ncbi:MAG: hypothetical protein ACR2QF_12635 [Geminicoccaceae bacterium]